MSDYDTEYAGGDERDDDYNVWEEEQIFRDGLAEQAEEHTHLPNMGTLEVAGEWSNNAHQTTYHALCENDECDRSFTLTLWRADLGVGTVTGTWTLDNEEDDLAETPNENEDSFLESYYEDRLGGGLVDCD